MPPPQQSNTQANPPAGQAPKYAPPPTNLPLYQRVDPKGVAFFAKTFVETVSEQKQLIFGIKRADRLRHIYALGKAGSGKSKALELIARQDIAYGHGVLVLDPVGDVVADLLTFIPKTRTKDVVLIDVTDAQHVFVWNPFVGVREPLRHRYAQALLEVFELQFGAAWGPRIEYVLRFLFLALLDYPHATFGSIVPMLTDDAFRKEVSGYVRDAGVRQFWTQEFVLWEERFSGDAVLPVISKVREIFSDPTLSAMFLSGESKFSVHEAVRDNRIVLVNLARAHLGVNDARFLSSLILSLFSVVTIDAGARGERKSPFYIFADDVLESITPMVTTMLSESRRIGVGAYLSHQYAGELSQALKRFLAGNMGTLLAFRMLADDALWLEPELAPTFKAKELGTLPPRVFVAKLTIDGNTQDPFLAELLVAHSVNEQPATAAREAAQQLYTVSRSEIQQYMLKRDAELERIRSAVHAMDQELTVPLSRAQKTTPVEQTEGEDIPTGGRSEALFGVPDEEGEATRELRDA